MRIAVCSIGTELVDGSQVDTNATWIAGRVRELGGRDVLHVAVDDDHDRIVTTLRWLAERVDGIVVGGGLGPTSDDRTRDAVAAALGVDLERRDDLVTALEDRYRSAGTRMPSSNLRQAEVPTGAVAMPAAGSAPGFTVLLGDVPLWVLPGVPWELRELFDRHVAPDLLERGGGAVTVTRVVHVTGLGESTVAELLADVEAAAARAGADVAYLAGPAGVQVKLTATGRDAGAVQDVVRPLVDDVVERLGPAAAGVDEDSMTVATVRALRARGWTVATAESATAGLVASRLGEVPGVSDVLRGGVVTYATDTKTSLVGVTPELLAAHPAVSREVTAAMAEGVRHRLDADVGVATTGVAGPAEQDGVPVGTCWWAVALPDGTTHVDGGRFSGDRDHVRARLATAALDALRRRVAP